MEKVENNVFIPMPMSVVGAVDNGKANFMAVGWISRANANPPMISIGIGKNHFTSDLIKKTGVFSVNIPGKDLLVKTDYVGIVSGEKVDKSEVFEVFYGDLKKAPLIKGSIVSLECKVVEAVDLPNNTVFIGEIVGAWAHEEYLDGKIINYNKGNAYFLTMLDNHYWGFGENLGKAWSIGNDLIKK